MLQSLSEVTHSSPFLAGMMTSFGGRISSTSCPPVVSSSLVGSSSGLFSSSSVGVSSPDLSSSLTCSSSLSAFSPSDLSFKPASIIEGIFPSATLLFEIIESAATIDSIRLDNVIPLPLSVNLVYYFHCGTIFFPALCKSFRSCKAYL